MANLLKKWDFTSRFLVNSWKMNNLKKQQLAKSYDAVKYRKKCREYGRWTKEYMEDLGPTFIKLGQILSTRNDIYSDDFLDEIQSLQDNVLPLSKEEVDAIISENCDFDMIDYIEDAPYKSASLGQVHKGKLKNGNDIVVKVLRPNVVKTIQKDVEVIDTITLVVRKFIGVTGSEIDMLKESINNLLKETDYILEV